MVEWKPEMARPEKVVAVDNVLIEVRSHQASEPPRRAKSSGVDIKSTLSVLA